MFSFVTYLIYLFVAKEEYINLYYQPSLSIQLESSLEQLNIDAYIVEKYGIVIRYKLGAPWHPLTIFYDECAELIYGAIKIDENIIPYIQWDSIAKPCCVFIDILETEYLLAKNTTDIEYNRVFLNTIPRINVHNEEEFRKFDKLLNQN